MRISSRLLSGRTNRSILLAAALLVALGYLLLGETIASRLLGSVGALVVAVLLKVAFELFGELRRLERDTSRLTNLVVKSSTEATESKERLERIVSHTESLFEDMRSRLSVLESTVSDLGEEGLRAQRRSHHRIEVVREEIARNVGDLATKIDDLVAAQQPVRRHLLTPNDPLRELTLQSSLAGLFTEDQSAGPR